MSTKFTAKQAPNTLLIPDKLPFSLAILGAGQMGKVHAQIFHDLGVPIHALLGSTNRTAAIAAQELENLLDVRIQSFSKLDELLQGVAVNAACICTPPHLHFEQMFELLDRDIAVFCEKPLFWHSGIAHSDVAMQLDRLERHRNRRLFVNTSNASFIDNVRARLPETDLIDSFTFQFHTQGRYQGKEIALDLLPHGLSLLIRLLGKKEWGEVSHFSCNITQTTYQCSFYYGHCFVKFDFQEIEKGDKKLFFSVNNRSFTRIQQNDGTKFRVFLSDSVAGDIVEIQEPSRFYIVRFLNFCKTSNKTEDDDFDEAAVNMRLMAGILLGSS